MRYCKSTIFQANHNRPMLPPHPCGLFAILQKYDFSSKSQPNKWESAKDCGCLRYCKSTIFQANHNDISVQSIRSAVVCDTAKVRFFKQITTVERCVMLATSCLRYCKSTIFQANHNRKSLLNAVSAVVCDTAKVRFFKQITTHLRFVIPSCRCLRYCKSTIFQANHNYSPCRSPRCVVVCDTAKVRFFKQITTFAARLETRGGCLRYCKSTIFQANHNKPLLH